MLQLAVFTQCQCIVVIVRTQWSPRLLVVGLGDLHNLDSVVNNEVHELVETLQSSC